MNSAYVLLTTNLGTEEEVMEELRSIPDVKEIFAVYGSYDIIAIINSETTQQIKELILTRLRRINNVKSTLTMHVVDKVSAAN
ncbi:Lrp/AsnC family transcriptional regulator [Candidatus Bathyarchaeota archaeon]|nr:Lrp/AsnC family transcriptional regulator [Candidatus Bathyarchaeota archaeon]